MVNLVARWDSSLKAYVVRITYQCDVPMKSSEEFLCF